MAKELGFREVDNVPLTRLHLDLENPRFSSMEDESQALAYLLRHERVLPLAKDIAAKGGISPLERVAAIEMDGNRGHYVVVEGNRRLCALKLLRDPASAPLPKIRRAIEAAAADASVASTVSLTVFRDRETARQWIALRHQGAQDGAGTRAWNSTQSSRFAKADTPNRLALAILDRAEQGGWISEDERSQLALTTLTRYLSNPVLRSSLGLGDRHELIFTHDAAEVDAALHRFIKDAMPRTDGGEALVHSRSNAKERAAYARRLQADGASPTTLLETPAAPPAAQPAAKTKRQRSSPNAGDRQSIVPSGFPVKTSDKALTKLFAELRQVDVDKMPYAANYLLRAFIERVMVLYVKKLGLLRPEMNDQKLTQACVEGFKKQGVEFNQYKGLRVAASSQDAHYSLHTLGAAVHARLSPSRRGLVATWDNWEHELGIMLSSL